MQTEIKKAKTNKRTGEKKIFNFKYVYFVFLFYLLIRLTKKNRLNDDDVFVLFLSIFNP